MAESVQISNNNVCAYTDQVHPKYVFYTGGIVGISDRVTLKGDPEALNCGADEVKLERK